ncbi:hypothetical protein [Streptomyces virginiae]|uniref:hypothetical protein n=1 Tax=Streptomyces virginiae TaxID=1961 RepID=UPI002DBB6193|nr:hypothetical protein [Streptomyces sp. CMAA1738]MEC4570164.1 hypothetical protein [Streptomyces sp. CMAA1738]
MSASPLDPRLTEHLRCWHIAPAGRPGTVALTGRSYFADGDGVTVLLGVSGDDALASDGGTMATRLADAGVDVWGPTRAATAWAQTLGDFRLGEVDGRIVGRRSLEQAESLVSDISSAMLTIDGLRWLAAPERDSKLVRQLYAYLDDARIAFDRRPTVELPRGAKVRPTARINLPKRTVLVQAVGGSEQGLEHALSLVHRARGLRLRPAPRTAEGQRASLARRPPRPLADHTPVGFSEHMDAVTRFLKEGTPLERPVTLEP